MEVYRWVHLTQPANLRSLPSQEGSQRLSPLLLCGPADHRRRSRKQTQAHRLPPAPTLLCLEFGGDQPGPTLSSPLGTRLKWTSTFSRSLHGQSATLHHCQSTAHSHLPLPPALPPCHASPPPDPWPRPPSIAQGTPHPRP